METSDDLAWVLILVPVGVLAALELIRVLSGFATRSDVAQAVLRPTTSVAAGVRTGLAICDHQSQSAMAYPLPVRLPAGLANALQKRPKADGCSNDATEFGEWLGFNLFALFLASSATP